MLKILEKAFLVFALLYFSQGLTLVLQPDDLPQSDEPPANISQAMLRSANKNEGADPTKKNVVKLAVEVGIYLITATLILFQLREFLHLFFQHKWLWSLLALAFFSTLWSDDPKFTVKRGLVLIASTCFGVYLGQRYTLREILRLLYIVGVIAAVASLIVVWRLPDLGTSSGGANVGDWRGIFGQKNALGRFMALEILVFGVGLVAEKGVWRWFCVLGSVLCLPLLIMAKAATAYLALPMLLVLLVLFQLARRHSLLKMVALLSTLSATIAGVVFVIIIEPKKLLMMMGKDTTLSGRTEIWSMVWQKFLQRPWLGYGYSAFWMGPDGKESAGIQEALHWAVPHSHNGFLDLLVQVGVVGLALFLVGYVFYFREALRCARASKTILGLFPLLYLAFMVLFNCSEGTIIRDESIFWVMYATIWVLTTRWLDLAEAAAGRTAMAVPTRKTVVPKAVPVWRFGSTSGY